MCDYLNEAYPSFYQQAWHSGTLWKMSVPGAQMHVDGSSGPASAPAMQLYPPVISAGIWHAVVRPPSLSPLVASPRTRRGQPPALTLDEIGRLLGLGAGFNRPSAGPLIPAAYHVC